MTVMDGDAEKSKIDPAGLKPGDPFPVPVGVRSEGQHIYVDGAIAASVSKDTLELVLMRQEPVVQAQQATVIRSGTDAFQVELTNKYQMGTLPVDVGHLRMRGDTAIEIAVVLMKHGVTALNISREDLAKKLIENDLDLSEAVGGG